MSSFYPDHPWTLLAVLGLDAVVVLAGMSFVRVGQGAVRRGLAWLVVGVAVIGMDGITREAGAGFRMLAICLGLLHAMKGLTHVEHVLDGGVALRWRSYLAYALLSFGMQPALLHKRRSPLPSKEFLVGGMRAIAVGVMVIFLSIVSRDSGNSWRLDQLSALPHTLGLLVGISLVFHSGFFQLNVAAWRLAGYPARLSFRAPLLARSLTEFWSQRWNLPFVEMTALTVFKPLRPLVGPTAASIGAFLVSGVFHELAISLPVRDGFGMPMAYFAIHAVLIRIEAVLDARACGPRTWGTWSFLWVVGGLLLPLPLCFHAAFLGAVMQD